MLRALRQGGFIKTLMGTVVVLIIVAFALDYRGKGVAGMKGGEDCAVEVDGTCVPMKDYNMLLRLVAPAGASDKEIKKAGFSQRVLDALVERELLLREGRRLGVAVSEADIDNELAIGRVHYSWPVAAPLPMALAQGSPYPTTGATEMTTYIRVRNSKTDEFDYEIYRRQLQSLLRMSPREFKEAQAEEVTAARVRKAVTASVRVSDDEAFLAYEHDKSQAIVRTVNVPRSWFERFVVEMSDKDVAGFAKDNAAVVDKAWESAKAHWTADCPLISDINIGFDSPNAEADHSVERAQADLVLKLVKAGLPFERAARAFGKGTSARYGGAIGCLEADKLPDGADIAKAIESLKAGELSGVIETSKGFHIVKFLGKQNAAEAERLGRLEVARKAAIEDAAKKRASAVAADFLAKAKSGSDLAAAVENSIGDLIAVGGLEGDAAEAVKKEAYGSSEKPEFEVSRSFNRSGSPMPGLKKHDLAGKVFDLAKADDVIDEVLETYAGYAVIQLKEKTLASREEFAKNKDQLLEVLQEKKRAEALSNYVARLREKTKKIVINPAFDAKPASSEEPGKAG